MFILKSLWGGNVLILSSKMEFQQQQLKDPFEIITTDNTLRYFEDVVRNLFSNWCWSGARIRNVRATSLIFKTKNRYKEEVHKLKFHIDGVHVLKENDTPDAHHDFTLAAHMKNLLLEKESVEKKGDIRWETHETQWLKNWN